MKIKKDVKPQLQKLPPIKLKYNFVVPFMGVIDMMTMISFYMNPVTDGRWFLKIFFLFFAAVGLIFAYWGFVWKVTADGKRIRVRPAFGRAREVPFAELKKAIVHKKAKNGSLIFYQLMDRDDKEIVKIYPLMRESGLFLERLKRLGIPIQEEKD